MSDQRLKTLPLHDAHEQAGARFAAFAGWDMPLQYSGIVGEHEAVRTGAGVFDVSHMGRVEVEGPDSGKRLRLATTYDIGTLEPGQAHYSLYCTEDGGIADDIFVLRQAPQRWLVVHNAAGAAAGLERLLELDVPARDITAATVMLAVQGPEARAAAASIVGESLLGLGVRRCVDIDWSGESLVVSRTGYTGEDGFEITAPHAAGGLLWERLLAVGVVPAGIGARDTLRLEAALPLHGNDIDATTHPYEAGLGWTVSLDEGVSFRGSDALARLSGRPLDRRLAHLRLSERGVPRPGLKVRDPASGAPLATLTSGSYSPTLRAGIGMAYLPVGHADPGTVVDVVIRDRGVPAVVVSRPFYRRPRTR